MLARKRRLTDTRSFALARRQGRACHGPLLTVASRPSGQPLTRVGFTVSKRVGGAVVRNTVKRRLRAAIRPLLPALTPGYDVVVVARPALATTPYAELAQSLAATLERARLMPRGTEGSSQSGPQEAP